MHDNFFEFFFRSLKTYGIDFQVGEVPFYFVEKVGWSSPPLKSNCASLKETISDLPNQNALKTLYTNIAIGLDGGKCKLENNFTQSKPDIHDDATCKCLCQHGQYEHLPNAEIIHTYVELHDAEQLTLHSS